MPHDSERPPPPPAPPPSIAGVVTEAVEWTCNTSIPCNIIMNVLKLWGGPSPTRGTSWPGGFVLLQNRVDGFLVRRCQVISDYPTHPMCASLNLGLTCHLNRTNFEIVRYQAFFHCGQRHLHTDTQMVRGWFCWNSIAGRAWTGLELSRVLKDSPCVARSSRHSWTVCSRWWMAREHWVWSYSGVRYARITMKE